MFKDMRSILQGKLRKASFLKENILYSRGALRRNSEWSIAKRSGMSGISGFRRKCLLLWDVLYSFSE